MRDYSSPIYLRIIYLLNIVSALICCYLIVRLHGQVFVGLDGTYILTLVKNQHDFMGFSPSLGMNFLQSQGNVFFPMNTYFIPSFLFFHIFNDGVVDKILAASSFAFGLYFATWFVASSIGFRPSVSLISAWTIVAIIAFANPPVIYANFNLIPALSMVTTYPLLLLGCFIRFGKGDMPSDIILFVVINIILVILFVGSPAATVLWAGSMLILLSSSYLSSDTHHEKKYKRRLFISLLILTTAVGVPLSIVGLLSYTPTFFFSNILANIDHGWQAVSILFEAKQYHSYVGPILWVGGILGASLSVAKETGLKRNIAIGVLLWAALCMLLGVYIEYDPLNYNGLLPVYLESVIWPFFSIFFVYLIEQGIKVIPVLYSGIPVVNFHETTISKEIRLTLLLVAPLLIPFISVMVMKRDKLDYGWVWPIPSNKIVDYLQNEIGLTEQGSIFKGRVLNTAAISDEKVKLGWYRQHIWDGQVVHAIHNDLRLTGMWYFNIPTLVEYSSLVSPAFFALVNNLLTRPGDLQLRGAIGITDVNANVLRMLGVRYVISNNKLPDPFEKKMTMELNMKPESRLYLYELSNTNIGNYSPTHVSVANNAAQVINKLKNPKLDLSQTVIMSDKIPGILTKALYSEMQIYKGFVRVRAISKGRSLIVLPLEFSHCLNISSRKEQVGGEDGVKLYRVNLNQVGVLFEGKIDIKLRLKVGFMGDQVCRLEDTKEMREFGLSMIGGNGSVHP